MSDPTGAETVSSVDTTGRVFSTRNVTTNWIVLGAGVLYSLVITPFAVHSLHAELYGIWTFLNGLVAYSELLYLGLGSSVIRGVAAHRAVADRASVNRLMSIVFTIYISLGAFCFVCFGGLSAFVTDLLGNQLSQEAARAAVYTCWFIGARLFLVFVTSTFAGFIYGHDRFDLVNKVALAGIALRSVLVPLSLMTTRPLLGLATATTAVALCEAAAIARMAFSVDRDLHVRPTLPRLPELRSLYTFGIQSFLLVLAVKLISYTDTTVIGIALGARSVALYSLPLQLVEYGRMAVGGFTGVFLPSLTVLVTKQDLATVRAEYLRATRIGGFIGGWLTGLLIALGTGFLLLWVGPTYAGPAKWIIVFLGLAGFCHVFASQVPFGFYQALHVLGFPARVLAVEAAINLAVSIALAPRLGITGVALATFLPAFCVSAPILPRFICRRLEIRGDTYWKEGLLPGVSLLAALLGSQWPLDLYLPVVGYLTLLLRGALTLPIVASVFLATFPERDRRQAFQLVRSSWRSLGVWSRVKDPSAGEPR